jgi:hypothetical protein
VRSDTEKNIFAFSQLGFLIEGFLQRLGLTQVIKNNFFTAIKQSVGQNPWFTEHTVRQSLRAIFTDMLQPGKLQEWAKMYEMPKDTQKAIGIIMAGNIPLVGFHDLLCVLMAGHRAVVKMSFKDSALLPVLAKYLVQIDHHFEERVVFVEKDLGKVDAVIATGSDNASRYFESAYGALPHIFRKNRGSVAVLTGQETPEQLQLLSNDVFSYFGLGCRNVSKIFVPENYDFTALRKAFSSRVNLLEHKNYADCYRYARAMWQMRKADFIDCSSCVLAPSEQLGAGIAEVLYQTYSNEDAVVQLLNAYQDSLQCIVADNLPAGLQDAGVQFGQTQHPALTDYADGRDVMIFCGASKIL